MSPRPGQGHMPPNGDPLLIQTWLTSRTLFGRLKRGIGPSKWDSGVPFVCPKKAPGGSSRLRKTRRAANSRGRSGLHSGARAPSKTLSSPALFPPPLALWAQKQKGKHFPQLDALENFPHTTELHGTRFRLPFWAPCTSPCLGGPRGNC